MGKVLIRVSDQTVWGSTTYYTFSLKDIFKQKIKIFSERVYVVVRRTMEECDLWKKRFAKGMGNPDSVLFMEDLFPENSDPNLAWSLEDTVVLPQQCTDTCVLYNCQAARTCQRMEQAVPWQKPNPGHQFTLFLNHTFL